ncbi:MAG: septal ring lytic transglycosylase RlpA family protein [Candidatus Acidiferrales bacterium]
MRRLLKIVRGGIFWALFLFLAIPLAQEPVVALAPQPNKPIRVWMANASWYGQEFQGRTTASGEPFDMNANTAAEPNLPFGSIVRLKNMRTGKSQLVRINDRGPYVDGRDLDVSYQVACNLGMVGRGVSRLRIELLEVPPRHE